MYKSNDNENISRTMQDKKKGKNKKNTKKYKGNYW